MKKVAMYLKHLIVTHIQSNNKTRVMIKQLNKMLKFNNNFLDNKKSFKKLSFKQTVIK